MAEAQGVFDIIVEVTMAIALHRSQYVANGLCMKLKLTKLETLRRGWSSSSEERGSWQGPSRDVHKRKEDGGEVKRGKGQREWQSAD